MSRIRSQQMIVHICRAQDPMNFPLTNYRTRVSPTITSRRFITPSFGRSTYFSHLFHPSNVRSVNVIGSQRRQVCTPSMNNKINFRRAEGYVLKKFYIKVYLLGNKIHQLLVFVFGNYVALRNIFLLRLALLNFDAEVF